MTVTTLELICLVVVAFWLAMRLHFGREARGPLLLRMLVIAVGALIAEDTCIRLYGFYFYNREQWGLMVDEVPLLVLLIWPVVVTSTIDLLETFRVPAQRWPLLMFALVVADAYFIEPAAVDAGLWTWTQPGPFSIPTIGIWGWGLYAGGIGIVKWRRWNFAAVLVVAPIVCHAMLLALWWVVFRWMPLLVSDIALGVIGWIISLSVVLVIVKKRPPGLRRMVWLRAPAAVFFFSLLAIHGRDADDVGLVIWCLAFAPPWLALLLCSNSPSEHAAV